MISVTSNFSRLKTANIAIQKATGRAAADVVNRSLKNVAFRAAQYTPSADPAKIENELLRDKLALKIVTKRLKAQSGTAMLNRQGSNILTKGGKARTYGRVTRKLIGLRTRQFIARRKKVRGYLKAGWFPAVAAFGGTITGRSRVISTPARLGYAKPATQARIFGEIANKVYAAIGKGRKRSRATAATQAMMRASLHRAVAVVAKENEAYARKKTREAIKLGHRTG